MDVHLTHTRFRQALLVMFYAYILVANVFAFVFVTRWVKPFGFVAIIAFGLAFAYLTIVTGRWLFGRKEL